MKKLIVSLLSVMTLSLSGLVLAGAPPVEAPAPVVAEVVAEVPAEKPTQEVATPEVVCKPTAQAQCASEEPVAKQEPAPVAQQSAS